MLMFFYQITTLLSRVALKRTLNTHGLHAKGAFLHRLRPLPTRLPIKRKGNCKSMKKNVLWWKKMGQAAPVSNWVFSCRTTSSTLYRSIVYNKIQLPECPSQKNCWYQQLRSVKWSVSRVVFLLNSYIFL